MHLSTVLLLVSAIGCTIAQNTVAPLPACPSSGVPFSSCYKTADSSLASCMKTESIRVCECSNVVQQISCWTNYCPGGGLDGVESQFSGVCGYTTTFSDNLPSGAAAATTPRSESTVSTMASGAETTPITTPKATAATMSVAGVATTTSKAAGNVALVPAGGILAVALGVVTYL